MHVLWGVRSGMMNMDKPEIIIFFFKLFDVSLDNIKTHIYFVQDYFRGEFFVPLKYIKIGGASLSNTLHKLVLLFMKG